MTTQIHSTGQARSPADAGLRGRYAAVCAAAWRARSAMAGVQHNADELAFLPAALSLQDTPVHPAPRRTAQILIALFALAVAWACLGTVDVVAIAPGRIIVAERSKLVQPLERSVVRRVLVRDGDHVQAGQALVELDATGATADKSSLQEQVRAARSEVVRTRLLQQAVDQPLTQAPRLPAIWATEAAQNTMTGGLEPSAQEQVAVQAQLSAEWSDIVARQARFAAEIRRRKAEIATVREMVAKLEATLPLSRKREDDMRLLSAQGFIANHAGQDRTRERIELERDLSTQQSRLQEAKASMAESESGQAAYLAETRRGLSERQAQAALRLQQAGQELAKALQREELTVLRAPATGQVQQLATHTVGGVVTEAQTLMVIVPDQAQLGPVVAEVTLENKDIGFVNTGQSAQIKLETFEFTRYGTIPATVELVSADAVQDEKRGAIFPARLVFGKSSIDVDGKPIRLSPGMNITAEIKTGQRRVIEFLLSPIQRAASESMRER